MNKSIINKESLKGITALLVHVANIDEVYTDKEKKIPVICFPKGLNKNYSML